MEHIVSLTILLSFKSSLSFSTGLELVILWKIMVYTDSTCLVFNAGALIVAHCRTLVGAHVPKCDGISLLPSPRGLRPGIVAGSLGVGDTDSSLVQSHSTQNLRYASTGNPLRSLGE